MSPSFAEMGHPKRKLGKSQGKNEAGSDLNLKFAFLVEIFVDICITFKILDHQVHNPIFFGNPMFPYPDQFVLVPIILW